MLVRPAGAGDCLVHRLPGAHLLLVPGLSGGERIQQGLCHLCRRPVVGNGESGHSFCTKWKTMGFDNTEMQRERKRGREEGEA